jgi:anti-sigma B factor antagonist
MADATATMEVRKPSDSVGIVDITGDITANSEDVLMNAYAEAGDGTKAVILNFSGLDYMNSGGIGLLVTLLVRANRAKQKLLAFGLTEHYKEIFQLTRLDEAVHIHDSEDEALAAAGA